MNISRLMSACLSGTRQCRNGYLSSIIFTWRYGWDKQNGRRMVRLAMEMLAQLAGLVCVAQLLLQSGKTRIVV